MKGFDRDAATVMTVESNLQRSKILPSEKAFAYKMRLDAMKRLPGRPTKENYSQVGNNFESATSSDELAEKVGESKNQIFRYICLTNLIPPTLDLVRENFNESQKKEFAQLQYFSRRYKMKSEKSTGG